MSCTIHCWEWLYKMYAQWRHCALHEWNCKALMPVNGVLHDRNPRTLGKDRLYNCMWIVHGCNYCEHTNIFVEVVWIIHLLLERMWIQYMPVGGCKAHPTQPKPLLAEERLTPSQQNKRRVAWLDHGSKSSLGTLWKVLEHGDVTCRVLH